MKTLSVILVSAFVMWMLFLIGMGMYLDEKKQRSLPAKGQHFDLRGGSTIIEVNPAEKVVWFRRDSDSTYFYEPFYNIGIQ